MPSPVMNSILDTDPVQVITGVNVMPKPNGLTITFDTRKGQLRRYYTPEMSQPG